MASPPEARAKFASEPTSDIARYAKQTGGHVVVVNGKGIALADTEQPTQHIDYATSTAKTTFGTIGVKVWIFKGEVVEDRRGKTYSTGV